MDHIHNLSVKIYEIGAGAFHMVWDAGDKTVHFAGSMLHSVAGLFG
jgi:hypothetical protein